MGGSQYMIHYMVRYMYTCVPVLCTCTGIRGEIYIKVTIEVLKDQNIYKHVSSEVVLFTGKKYM